MGEKIETLHTKGKQGRCIDKTKHETIREAALACSDGGELTHAQLNASVEQKVGHVLRSNCRVGQNLKIDLESRKLIRRMRGAAHYILHREKTDAFRLQADALLKRL